jgi:predicted kinase
MAEQAQSTLIATVGLPRSGKTTWALVTSRDHGWPVVSPDAIRQAIHGQRFIAEAESFVWATAKAMVRALFLAGHCGVIVDATNTTRKRRDEWKAPHWTTVFNVIDTPADVCRDRAAAAGDSEILPVIDRMAAQYEPLGEDELAAKILGATGDYPDGRYGPEPEADEGALQLAMLADRRAGLVRVEFGKPVAWLGLRKLDAIALADKLRFQASKLDG